jgi:hypothetical protein
MATLQVLKTSIVVLGDVFTPSLLTPDLLSQFFKDERPRGLATTMVSVLEYPQSGYRFTLERNRFEVSKEEPDPARLGELVRVESQFLKKNPLVKVTAVGLNFIGFVSYDGATDVQGRQEQRGELKFLSTFMVLDPLQELVGSKVESGMLQIIYDTNGNRCRLALQSDAVVKDNRGAGLDLNVHKDVSKRTQVPLQIARLEHWFSYFVGLGERLSRHFER